MDRMREAAGAHYSTATDLADYLVRKGLPFREAHEVVGRAVRHGHRAGARSWASSPLEELRRFSPLIGRDVYEALTVEASLRARAVIGGTAPEAVAPRSSPRRRRCSRAGRRVRRPARGALAAASLARRWRARRLRQEGPAGGARSGGCPLPPAGMRAAVEERAVVVSWTNPRNRVDGTRAARPGGGAALPARRGRGGQPKPAMLSSATRGRLRRDRARSGSTRPRPRPCRAPVTWVGPARALGRAAATSTWSPPRTTLGRSSAPSERLVVTFLAAPKAPARSAPRRATRRSASPGSRRATFIDGTPATGELRYLVLRGAGSGGALAAVTPPPIAGTTFTDDGPRQRHRLSLRGARGARGSGGQRDGAPSAAVAAAAARHDAARRARQPASRSRRRGRCGWRGTRARQRGRGALRDLPGGRRRAHFIRIATTQAIATVYTDRDVQPGTDLPLRGHRARPARRPNESARSNVISVRVP